LVCDGGVPTACLLEEELDRLKLTVAVIGTLVAGNLAADNLVAGIEMELGMNYGPGTYCYFLSICFDSCIGWKSYSSISVPAVYDCFVAVVDSCAA
jgi:hypothetical protein